MNVAFHCLQCDGNGYHTDDCPHASSACKRETWCFLQAGHKGSCSPTLEVSLKMSVAEMDYRGRVLSYENPVAAAQSVIVKHHLDEQYRYGPERKFAAAMLRHARKHERELKSFRGAES